MDYLVGRPTSRKNIAGGVEYGITWTSAQDEAGNVAPLSPRLTSIVQVMADGTGNITLTGGSTGKAGSLTNARFNKIGFAADVAWSDGTQGDASVTTTGRSASVAVDL